MTFSRIIKQQSDHAHLILLEAQALQLAFLALLLLLKPLSLLSGLLQSSCMLSWMVMHRTGGIATMCSCILTLPCSRYEMSTTPYIRPFSRVCLFLQGSSTMLCGPLCAQMSHAYSYSTQQAMLSSCACVSILAPCASELTAAPSGFAARRRSATTASAFCLRDTRSCCCSSHSLRSLALMPAVGARTSSAARRLILRS